MTKDWLCSCQRVKFRAKDLSKEKLSKLFSTTTSFFQGRWNISSLRSHSVSLWRHHTNVCPTPVIVSTRKPILSSLSSTRRGGSSTWYSELNEHKHNVILLFTDVGFLCLSVNTESKMLLIVLLLVHFLPHLGSFPSSIRIRLPMTTLPWSVFHQLEWFIQYLQSSSSLPQPHQSVFFPSSTWPNLSCRQYVRSNCLKGGGGDTTPVL